MLPFHDVNNLRLEVETAPSGLPNLILNPSGAQGAWFWATPVANTVMTSSGTALTFKTTVAQACNFTTDYMPVAATKYVSLRIDINAITASHNVKTTYDFYSANKTLLSSSAQGTAMGALGTNYGPTAQAPAGTAYVKARFDFYNGTGNASANASVTFNQAMVTWQDSGTISTFRTNLVSNPSFEVDTAGWESAYTFFTHTRTKSTAQAVSGTASMALSWSGGGGVGTGAQTLSGTSGMPVTGGATYALRMSVRGATVGANATCSVTWYSSTGAYLSQSSLPSVAYTASAWTTITGNASAPSNAAYAAVQVIVNTAAGVVTYVDAVAFEKASSVASYFDGSTTDTATYDYAWSGTVHLSASTETTVGNTFGYADPYVWRNILGPTHSIQIDRAALDVGTMSAEVLDEALDPAVSTDLQPGKRVRLQALVSGVWESVFEGRLTNAKVIYDRDEDAAGLVIRARIHITAQDNIAALANQSEARGLATIPELPYILEGRGVPWNVNGSGNQVATATQVSSNENSSVLAQVGLTRDSVSGYAWVDRYNVLQVWDRAQMPTELACQFGDAPIYSTARTNLYLNPTFETAESWTALASSDNPARSTEQAWLGDWSVKATRGAGTSAAIGVHTITSLLTAGAGTYRVTAHVWVPSLLTANAGLRIGGTGITATPLYPTSRDQWEEVTATVTWDGVGTVQLQAYDTAITAGAYMYLDGICITAGPDYVPYFDGDSQWSNWDGTAQASTSTYDATAAVSYSAIDAGFNTDSCINEVTVNWLRYNPTDGTTESVPYGPYRSNVSQELYGPHAATYTLHGATEDALAIGNFAFSIIEANATPQRRANSLTFPVKDAASLAAAARVDLNSLAGVILSGLIDDQYRVTGIKHTLDTERWHVTYEFETQTSVASPSPQSAPLGSGNVTDGTWIPVTFQNGWANYVGSGNWATCAYMRRNGIVYLKGMAAGGTNNAAIFTLPAGYRPAEDNLFSAMGEQVSETTGAASTGTAHTHPVPTANAAYRVDVLETGEVKKNINTGTNTWVTLSGISFPVEQ